MPLRPVEFHVMLALESGACHGYGVMQDVAALSGGAITIGPGTLYTAIKRLVAAGLIETCEPDAERRRCYQLTKAGRRAAAAEARRLAALVKTARKRGLLPSTS